MSTVRRLLPDDWALLRQVRLAALADAPAAVVATLTDMERPVEADWRDNLVRVPTFAALDGGGAPVGMVAWTRDASAGRRRPRGRAPAP